METLLDNTATRAMNKFATFQLNYPHDFIEVAFKYGMTDHLRSKFNGFYAQYGSIGAMIMFWSSLDHENRIVLNDYILTLSL